MTGPLGVNEYLGQGTFKLPGKTVLASALGSSGRRSHFNCELVSLSVFAGNRQTHWDVGRRNWADPRAPGKDGLCLFTLKRSI